jgi:uncharacterized protein YlzI (FlbEa/FlbD family)
VSLKRFTRPDGGVVLINPDAIQEVRSAQTATGDPPAAHAVIVLENGGFQAVRETVEEVEEKLK